MVGHLLFTTKGGESRDEMGLIEKWHEIEDPEAKPRDVVVNREHTMCKTCNDGDSADVSLTAPSQA